MATLTNWVEHLTTDVDPATDGIQVAGEIYPMVGTEGWLLLLGIIFWLAWHFATGSGEAETPYGPDGSGAVVDRLIRK